jgi:hypothetical protein
MLCTKTGKAVLVSALLLVSIIKSKVKKFTPPANAVITMIL